MHFIVCEDDGKGEECHLKLWQQYIKVEDSSNKNPALNKDNFPLL